MSYSGKKRRHTHKMQLVINKRTEQVICVHLGRGRTHDFALLKESRLLISKGITKIVDTGYIGIERFYGNVIRPAKSSKKHKLTKEEKEQNKMISKLRAIIEIVIGRLKRFRILSEKYRNKGKKFGLRFNLIAALYNKLIAAKN